MASGESLLSPKVTGRLIAEFVVRTRRPTPPSLSLLIDREREVMALVGPGLSNVEIAGPPFISGSTAKTHVSRTMIKLNARDRAQRWLWPRSAVWSGRTLRSLEALPLARGQIFPDRSNDKRIYLSKGAWRRPAPTAPPV